MAETLDTAGERLQIHSDLGWVSDVIEEGAAGSLRTGAEPGATVSIAVEADKTAFNTRDWPLLARGARARGNDVVIENVLTSGFDVLVHCSEEHAEFTFRWRPPARDRVVARVLRSRFHLLARAALSQYPALWWAGTRHRVPLHVSAYAVDGAATMVVAPSGVGRSTLVDSEVEAGAVATGDNLAVGDGATVWGLVEPVRMSGGTGRRMPHGRTESHLAGRVESLDPDVAVVLTRGEQKRATLVECAPALVERSLVTSTYTAGELRRYWAFAAMLAAGTGQGPAHPPISEVARTFAAGLRCYSLVLGEKRTTRLSDLLASLDKEPAWA
jgi:hypothetical protein